MKNKVLIVTLVPGHNYGGILQAYALQHMIRMLGYEVETTGSTSSRARQVVKSLPMMEQAIFLFRRLRGGEPITGPGTEHTSRFVREKINFIPFHQAYQELSKGRYEAVITGSDQVWRKAYAYLPHTFLGFVNNNVKKLSYAASFGLGDIEEYSRRDRKIAEKQLSRYVGISVRESSGVSLIKEEWGLRAEDHIDPTLVLDQDIYLQLSVSVPHVPRGIFIYMLDPTPEKEMVENALSQGLDLKSYSLINGDKNDGNTLPPVEEWVASFRDAQYVLTDSFHGMLFSIIFQKPFIVLGNKARGLARFESILKKLGLEGRLIDPEVEFSLQDVNSKMLESIEWSSISNVLQFQRREALKYLSRILG